MTQSEVFLVMFGFYLVSAYAALYLSWRTHKRFEQVDAFKKQNKELHTALSSLMDENKLLRRNQRG